LHVCARPWLSSRRLASGSTAPKRVALVLKKRLWLTDWLCASACVCSTTMTAHKDGLTAMRMPPLAGNRLKNHPKFRQKGLWTLWTGHCN
ncbi:hypothetical protein, partial [Frateuria defendens]|uniref:hypothetical protein n=1 Tax=Frateuria defendens TaxID=2219559 RepID=UPI001F44FD4B